MAISEEDRHHLYQRLEQVLGPREATTLMSHLPPVGWSEVATKRDIGNLESVTRRDIGSLGQRFDDFDQRFDQRLDGFGETITARFEARLERELRLQTWRFVTVVIALAGAVLAGVRL